MRQLATTYDQYFPPYLINFCNFLNDIEKSDEEFDEYASREMTKKGFTGRPNPKDLKNGGGLSRYKSEFISIQSFSSLAYLMQFC